MTKEEKPLEAAATAAAQELTRQLYGDVKSWLPTLWRWLKRQHRRATTETYLSPAAALEALKRGVLRDGDLVTVECKPALFGPFLRDHFLSPIIGNHTSLRLGPPIVAPNPIFGMMAQATSQLTPMGLFPALDDDVSQACLYPSDASACGFLGLFPGINDLVPYIPAVLAARHTPFCNVPCHVTGEARLMTADLLVAAGFQAEAYEELRQSGSVWILDATSDESACTPLGEGVTTELWGGLYASGHLELASGELDVAKAVEAMAAAISSAGYDVRVDQNRAGRQEVLLYARGFRACLDSHVPYFSLHMDADLALDFGNARTTFDQICEQTLSNLQDVCHSESVELNNPADLDFTYSNSVTAFSVMGSLGAEAVRDPLVVAIRDWHRRRKSQ